MCLDVVFRGISPRAFVVIAVIVIGLDALNVVSLEDGCDISSFPVTSDLHGAL